MQALSSTQVRPVRVSNHAPYVLPFILCVIYGLYSEYFYLSIIGGFSLAIIIRELWKPLLPPVLLYLFVFHWAQVFTVVPYIDFLDGNFDHAGEFVDINLDTYEAQFLVGVSLVQVALMAVIVGLYLKRVPDITLFTLKKAALQLDTKKVLFAFFISTVIFPPLIPLFAGNPSIIQLIHSATILRKVFLILLVFILFIKNDKYTPVIIAILVVEFILSFTAFFSEFKEIILFVLIGYFTISQRIKFSIILKSLPIVCLLGFVLIFWSYVKPGYRDFVSGGSKQQVVYVSKEEALGYLGNKLDSFDKKSFNAGVEILLERIETMTLYFKVYERVPAMIPHTNGENIMSSVGFLTLPRSLNPNKEVLDPSTKSTYYTGIAMANAEQGTSIAMGYFPDAYIDFGIYGMLVPIILIAMLIGWSGKYILQRKQYNLLFNYSLLIAIVFSFGTLDSDITFLLGAFRNLFVIYLLGLWFLFPWINKSISKD